jgi:formate C-acetyltransferase
MSNTIALTRREMLWALGAAPAFAGLATPSTPRMGTLRRAIVEAPVDVALERARVFTRVFSENEGRPWIVNKGAAMREYFRTAPLYVRPGDRLAGSISEKPGAMPVYAEIGIAENNIYTGENPKRKGYLQGKVPEDIREYWANRNLWGRCRNEILGMKPVASAKELPSETQYKFVSCQGHLSPAYKEVLEIGLGGILHKVRALRKDERDAEKIAFLTAAEYSIEGLSDWIVRYGEYLTGDMARIAKRVAIAPPETFHEAMQLIWFVHQAVHIEGHGYSCAPDHVDQLLYPYFSQDKKAGRLTDAGALELCENFTLKMYDNTFWGPEHHLTQGLMVGGSTPDGKDLTNRLSWLFIEGATNMSLPEPLVWIRWHPKIDQEFFDYCLSRLARGTCFPMMWNDRAIPPALMELGVAEKDAYNYISVGCNELAVPGQFYFNPGAHANYLSAINKAMNRAGVKSFDEFTSAFGEALRESIAAGYKAEMKHLQAQVKWGVTPLTSCFFDGCVEKGRDMALGTKYNILSCGGVFFANAVDSLAAIREVVYMKQEATLQEVAAACKANFKGYERLRAKLLAAPKHGNDDPRLDEIIRLVERLRDEPMKEICRDPRDGTPMGNGHVVRSSAVRTGLVTGATPDGRLAGTPLASSVASSVGCERSGPTAVLNSVTKLNGVKSWQTGYQVNLRFQGSMISKEENRDKVRAMLNVYFMKGGQELQINAVDSEMLRAAQKNPQEYRDLVVRIAGFSEFFVNLTPEMQEEIINRTAHM